MLDPGGLQGSERSATAVARLTAAASPRILVIDDDHLHRMILCRVAAKAGYEAAGAGSFEEAAELTQNGAFACITLDLSLGTCAGAEMLRHLHNIGCKAPIIIVSGCDDLTCRETTKVGKALDLDVRDTIHKPVDLAALRARLERIKTERQGAAA
jgi:two-component system, chemotaxis family, chemotaxis protein CheY